MIQVRMTRKRNCESNFSWNTSSGYCKHISIGYQRKVNSRKILSVIVNYQISEGGRTLQEITVDRVWEYSQTLLGGRVSSDGKNKRIEGPR